MNGLHPSLFKQVVIEDGVKKFKHQSFNDYLQSLRLSGSYKSVSSSSDAILSSEPLNFQATYFAQALVRWEELDCTGPYKSFQDTFSPFSNSLDSISSNFSSIFSSLSDHLSSLDTPSVDSFFSIACALARDVPTLVASNFQSFLIAIMSPIAVDEGQCTVPPQRIDATFKGIALLFKLLNKNLLVHFTELSNICVKFLSHKVDFVRKLFAQSFAAFFRSFPPDLQLTTFKNFVQIFVEFMTFDCLYLSNLEDGIQLLTFEIIRVSEPYFHSQTSSYLSILIEFEAITSSLIPIFDLITSHGDSTTVGPIFENLVQIFEETRNKSLFIAISQVKYIDKIDLSIILNLISHGLSSAMCPEIFMSIIRLALRLPADATCLPELSTKISRVITNFSVEILNHVISATCQLLSELKSKHSSFIVSLFVPFVSHFSNEIFKIYLEFFSSFAGINLQSSLVLDLINHFCRNFEPILECQSFSELFLLILTISIKFQIFESLLTDLVFKFLHYYFCACEQNVLKISHQIFCKCCEFVIHSPKILPKFSEFFKCSRLTRSTVISFLIDWPNQSFISDPFVLKGINLLLINSFVDLTDEIFEKSLEIFAPIFDSYCFYSRYFALQNLILTTNHSEKLAEILKIFEEFNCIFSGILNIQGKFLQSHAETITALVQNSKFSHKYLDLFARISISFLYVSFVPVWKLVIDILIAIQKRHNSIKIFDLFKRHYELSVTEIFDENFESDQNFVQKFPLIDSVTISLEILNFRTKPHDVFIELSRLFEKLASIIRSNLTSNNSIFKFLLEVFNKLVSNESKSMLNNKRIAWMLRIFAAVGGLPVPQESGKKNRSKAQEKPSESTLPSTFDGSEFVPIFEPFLSKSDPSFQYLGYRCVAAFSQPEIRSILTSFMSSFTKIINDTTFRVELVNYDLDETFPPSVRPIALPKLIALLIGKLLHRGGNLVLNIPCLVSKGANRSISRHRSVITSFLSRLPVDDLDYFINFIAEPFIKANLFPISRENSLDQITSSIICHVSSSKCLGFLNMLGNVFAHIGVKAVKYLTDFFKLILAILNTTIKNFESETLGENFEQFKIRQSSIKNVAWKRVLDVISIIIAVKNNQNVDISDIDHVFHNHFFEIAQNFIPIIDPNQSNLIDSLSNIPPILITSFYLISTSSFISIFLSSPQFSLILRSLLLFPRLGATKMNFAKQCVPLLNLIGNLIESSECKTFVDLYSSELIETLSIFLFSVKTTRKRLLSKNYANHLSLLLNLIKFGNSRDASLVLNLVCPLLSTSANIESVATIVLQIVTICLEKNPELPRNFLISVPKLFLYLKHKTSQSNLIGVYRELLKHLDQNFEFFEILQDMCSFTAVGDMDFVKRVIGSQIFCSKISSDDVTFDWSFILPAFYCSFNSLLRTNDLPLRTASANVINQIILYVSNQTEDQIFAEILNNIITPLLRQHTSTPSILARSEFILIFKQLILLENSPNSVKDLKIFITKEQEACPFENLANVQNSKRLKALRKISTILTSDDVSVTQANLTQFFGKLAFTLLSDCTQNSDSGLFEGVVDIFGALSSRLTWKNYYSYLIKFCKAINSPATLIKKRFKPEEIKFLEIRLIQAFEQFLRGWHFDNFNEDQLKPLQMEVEEQEEENDEESSEDEGETSQDEEEKDDESDDDSEKEEEEKNEGEGENEVEGEKEVENDDVIESKVSKSQDDTSLIDPQSSPIFISIISKILPSILRLLRPKKAPKQHSAVGRKRDRRGKEIPRAKLAVSYVILLKKLPDTKILHLLPRVINILIDGLRDEDQNNRDLVRNSLCDLVFELNGRFLDSFVSSIKVGLPRGFDRHVAVYTIHSIMSRLQGQIPSFYANLIISDCLELIFEELLGGTGNEKEVSQLATRGRESGAKCSLDLARLLAQNIDFSPNATLIMAALKAAGSCVTSLSALTKLENLTSSIISGFLSCPRVDTSAVLAFVYCLFHWEDLQNQKIPVVVKFSKLYGFQDARSIMIRAETSNNSLDSSYINSTDFSRPTFDTTFSLPPPVDFSYVKTTENTERSQLLLPLAGVSLLLGILKKRSILIDLHQSLISLIPDLIGIINSKQSTNEILTQILKILNIVLGKKDLIIEDQILDQISDSLFELIRRSSSAKLETYSILGKCFLSLLERRDYRQSNSTVDDDMIVLITFCRTKLFDSNQNDSALSLIRTIVSQGFGASEMQKLIEKYVSRFLLTSPSSTSRKLCNDIITIYLTADAYVAGENFDSRKIFGFLTANLSYELDSGREAVVETLYNLISKMSNNLIVAQYSSLFLSLLLQIEKETSAVIKEMVTSTTLLLAKRVSLMPNEFNSLVDFVKQWLTSSGQNSAQKSFQLHQIGILAAYILCQSTVDSNRWTAHNDVIFELISKIFNDAVGTCYSLWITIKNHQSDLKKELARFANERFAENVAMGTYSDQNSIESIKSTIRDYQSKLAPVLKLVSHGVSFFKASLSVMTSSAQNYDVMKDIGPMLLTCCRFFDFPELISEIAKLFVVILNKRDATLATAGGIPDAFLAVPGVLRIIATRFVGSLAYIADKTEVVSSVVELLVVVTRLLVSNPEIVISNGTYTFYLNSFEQEVKQKVPSFIASLFEKINTLADQEVDNQSNSEVEMTSSSAIKPILLKLCSMAKHPKSPNSLREVCVRLLGVIVSDFNQIINDLVIMILDPLYVIVNDTGALKINDETKSVANEVMDVVKKSVGINTFVEAMSSVRDERQRIKTEIQQKRAVMAVSDPAEYSRTMLQKSEQRRKHRHRKTQDNQAMRAKISLRDSSAQEPPVKKRNSDDL
ncbi:hypothetical protein RCL1_003002 [Eukaryota sp. TZLM3-RCL]